MIYAKKVIISRDQQLSPIHRHDIKAGDIINRGGGDKTLATSGHLRLSPGESVTLMPGVWHAFWPENGDCLIGEVSTVNDDRTDNVFEMPIGRFSKITEDVAPKYLLVSDD